MRDSLDDLLKEAERDLFTATKLSRQRSYHRRAPSPESLPHFSEARRALLQILKTDATNRKALLMMAQVCEGLMNFKGAIEFLNKAFAAGEPRTKKHLKKLALMRENAEEWHDLVLSPEELRELGEYLLEMKVGSANRSFDITKEWLETQSTHDVNEVIESLERRGAFSDFQVLANVVYG